VPSVEFVKLGGSLITDKTQPFTAREEVIGRLSREIAESWDTHEGRIVIGHGSGSFGHVAAERSGLLDDDSDVSLAEGVSRTQRAAQALHRRVTDALRDAGVPVFSFAPSSAFVASAGEPVEVCVEPVARALELGVVPVTYGDVVMDRERGATICSTETVLRALIDGLAGNIKTRRVLWFGDTEGVYDAGGQTIEKLPPDRIDALLEDVGAPSGTDVTGGMRHRLHVARELAHRGIPSLIASGLRAGHLRRALRGQTVPGTTVRAGEAPGK
jgi:isopentenyl phosphate kinase